MTTTHERLETTCKQFIDSLLGSKTRHTLCLNIQEDGFQAERVAADYLRAQGETNVLHAHEPSPGEFSKILSDLGGKTVVVDFRDLDKHPKCIDLLAEHVKKQDVGGRLVVVSQHWNSDNTEKERELRKSCLFFQQNLPKKTRTKKEKA